MDNLITDQIDILLARRLKSLRVEHDWSLEELARRSSVSRATLSRLENAEVSPTTAVLARLCTAYGLTMSRLMLMVENEFPPLVRHLSQLRWQDPAIGFQRRLISPPARTLAGEVLECELAPGTTIHYDQPLKEGQEHHLVLIEGQLSIRVNGQNYELHEGDCLRYQLFGASTFATPEDQSARYMLFMI